MDSRKPRARIEVLPSDRHPYVGLTAGFATKHRKVPLVRPDFHATLSMEILEVPFDTDTLGTFSGETPRPGTALETAYAKARIAADANENGLGLGSEGTIGPSASIPFVISDIEIVAFVDDRRGLRIAEHAVSHDIRTIALTVEPHAEFRSKLAAAGFPDHGVIVKPADGAMVPLHKGLHDFERVRSAVRVCAIASSDGRARIESDLRADHCPSRRPAITAAARRLALRLRERCPSCETPGWGVVRAERGVPCSLCGEMVDIVAREILGCGACNEHRPAAKPLMTNADPSRCPRCNP